MIMKKLWTLIITLLFTLPLPAQSDGKSGQSPAHLDNGGNKIMESLSKKFQNYSTVKIDFTYTMENEGKVLNTQKGSIAIRGEYYYLSFTGQEFFGDGKTIWNYQKETNEISIFEEDDSDESLILNPVKLLANWQNKFKARLIREEKEKGKTIILIDITPEIQQSFYRIRFFIDEVKNEIVRFIVYEKDNTTYTYTFDTFSFNKPIEDHYFRFDPDSYPNATINDMR